MSIITVAGGIGCDLDLIAQSVAEQLNLPLLDDQKLLDEAEKMGLSTLDGMESLKEKTPGFLSNLFTNKIETYRDMMEAVVLESVRSGNAVIPGHCSQMILSEFDAVLHVRLFASIESRIKKLSEQQEISLEAAARIIHKSDSEKRGFIHTSFHMDWDDLSLYDLVVNRDKMDVKSTVKLITDAAETEKIKAGLVNPEESLVKKALVKLVESTLLKEKMAPRLFVEATGTDKIRLYGFADSVDTRNRVIKLVESIPGVSEVTADIAIYYMGQTL